MCLSWADFSRHRVGALAFENTSGAPAVRGSNPVDTVRAGGRRVPCHPAACRQMRCGGCAGALEPPSPDVLARLLACGLTGGAHGLERPSAGVPVVFLNACETALQVPCHVRPLAPGLHRPAVVHEALRVLAMGAAHTVTAGARGSTAPCRPDGSHT